MKSIRLLGSKPKSHPFPVISWGIRLLEWSDISHVGLLFSEENKVFHAHFNNIRFDDLDEYNKVHSIKYNIEIKVTDDQYRRLLEFKDKLVGPQEGYYCSLFGTMIPQIIRNISLGLILLPNFCFWNKKGKVCSELARECVEVLGNPDSLLINRKICPDNYTTKDAVKLYKKIAETS